MLAFANLSPEVCYITKAQFWTWKTWDADTPTMTSLLKVLPPNFTYIPEMMWGLFTATNAVK